MSTILVSDVAYKRIQDDSGMSRFPWKHITEDNRQKLVEMYDRSVEAFLHMISDECALDRTTAMFMLLIFYRPKNVSRFRIQFQAEVIHCWKEMDLPMVLPPRHHLAVMSAITVYLHRCASKLGKVVVMSVEDLVMAWYQTMARFVLKLRDQCFVRLGTDHIVISDLVETITGLSSFCNALICSSETGSDPSEMPDLRQLCSPPPPPAACLPQKTPRTTSEASPTPQLTEELHSLKRIRVDEEAYFGADVEDPFLSNLMDFPSYESDEYLMNFHLSGPDPLPLPSENQWLIPY